MIITNSISYPIQPKDIDTENHFWNAFGNTETEVSANWLISFAQERGSWKPFTMDEINKFYHRKFSKQDFWFNRLTRSKNDYIFDEEKRWYEDIGWVKDWIIEFDGMFYFTHEFITLCFKSSPKK